MKVKIRQILDRAVQGQTRPFLCAADDGEVYFVKGLDAGRGSLISEWVAGRLAQLLGLPVPEFRLIEVESDFLEYSAFEEKGQLGSGVWFGSRRVIDSEELTWKSKDAAPRMLRAEILLFDWWVANGDRALTERGGNPNLLWSEREQRVYMIDHNLAFDAQDLERYISVHVFKDAVQEWTTEFRERQVIRLSDVASRLDQIWAEMPPEWCGEGCDVKFDSVKDLLWRFSIDAASFWRLP